MRELEEHAVCLRGTFVLVRLDGRGFTRFCARHGFAKPNDARAAMNRCALKCPLELPQFPKVLLGPQESTASRSDATLAHSGGAGKALEHDRKHLVGRLRGPLARLP